MADEKPREEAETAGGGAAGGPVPGGRARRAWPVVAAAVAVAVTAGGLYGARAVTGDDSGGGAGSGESAMLVLDGPSPRSVGAAEGAGGAELGAVWSGAAQVRLAGSPGAAPEEAPVHWFADVTEERVAGLGAALGLAGAPEQGEDGSWTVRADGAAADGHGRAGAADGGGLSLRVGEEAPGHWYFGPDAAAQAGAGDSRSADAGDGDSRSADAAGGGEAGAGDTGTGDTSTGNAGTGGTGGAAPSKDEALTAAAPVLDALGLGGSEVTAEEVAGPDRIVRAAPEVGGLPVQGTETHLYIGGAGELRLAFGTLHAHEAGEPRAVTGVAEAVDAYNRAADAPGPVPGCGPGAPADTLPVPEDGSAGAPAEPSSAAEGTCPAPAEKPEPVEVTAEFGLALNHAEGEPVLVPSWLFRGTLPSGEPFAGSQPAVPFEYRAEPGDAGPARPDEPAEPAQPAEPDRPADPARPVEPGTPDEAPAGDGGGWSVAPYEASDETLTVTFWASPCDEYEAVARESADEVTVGVEVTNPDPERVCVMLAEERTAEVRLAAPVGDRTVLDESGRELPVR
ncbi:hypothetical protein [Streptomyces marincola]|uniref:hypothetical protein n=1 Tax=Streptomyces marincola TaxID=2878388 RepID=UPI001CF32A5E|nr:hypothetical protein [Streptomyces marincola]UCM92015.1 hypothetical protein LC193_05440 [Streptomyces marincola]